MGNSDSNPWITQVQDAQEIEKMRFASDLRKNPDDFNRYVSERIERITGETLDKKRAAFQKAHTDLGRYMDMDHNANFYKLRNEDLIGLQKQMEERSRAVKSGIKHDKDLTRRQVEINEWYYGDKLETLFFLQMFFMIMLAEAIVLFLQKNSFITSPFASFLTFILFGVVAAVGLYRWRYTSDMRDSRFWQKRNFREKEIYIPTKEEPASCADQSDFVPKGLKDCAAKAAAAATAGQNYLAESAGPYGQIAMDASAGFGAAGDQLSAGGSGALGSLSGGINGAASTFAATTVTSTKLLGRQALSDAKSVQNRAGAAAEAAASELESQTIAYITGDNRVQSSGGQTCPF